MRNDTGILLGFVVFFVSTIAIADVRLPSIFGDNMVLQRDMPVPVWGWADPGEKITVAFAGQSQTATSDDNGKWEIKLAPLKMSKSVQKMVVTGNNIISFKDVLVGEVWVCSGQSNMQMTVNGSLQNKLEISTAVYPQIRLMAVPRLRSDFPIADPKVKWMKCSPGTVSNFSAVAYFFGRRLFKELDVPIGLISANLGGSRIEPWIPPAGFRLVSTLDDIRKRVDSWDTGTETGNKNYREFMVKLKLWAARTEKAIAAKKPLLPYRLIPEKINPQPSFLTG